MKYSSHTTQTPARPATERRSVAETLLETISETLSQGGLRPGSSGPAVNRRRRARRLAGSVAMLGGLAALGFVFLWPAAGARTSAGEPVAFFEIARGRAQMAGGDGSTFMLAGGEPIYAGAVIETAGAGAAGRGRAAIRLAGGQSVRLDDGSRVRFADRSSVVLERGALYVDSDAGANVEVRTALGVVRDIGTQFEVRLIADAGGAAALRIRVREGSIELTSDDQTHLVVAGEELRRRGDGTVERAASPIYGPHWDWVLETAKVPDVAGRPLQDFLDWAEREGGWTVRFADQATSAVVAETVLHGDLRDLSLTEAASVALEGSGLDYQLEDGTFVVVPAAVSP